MLQRYKMYQKSNFRRKNKILPEPESELDLEANLTKLSRNRNFVKITLRRMESKLFFMMTLGKR